MKPAIMLENKIWTLERVLIMVVPPNEKEFPSISVDHCMYD